MLVRFKFKVDRGGQPALVVMPDHLTYLADNLVDSIECHGPIDLGFEPLPETFDGIILRGIRRQMLESNPVMVVDKPRHGKIILPLVRSLHAHTCRCTPKTD